MSTRCVGSSESRPYGPFLAPQDLIRAIDGNGDWEHPLARWARALGSLYRLWLADPTAAHIGRRIAAIVHDIDVWVTAGLPRPRPGVPRATDSLGGVVARVAEAAAHARWTLHCDQNDLRRHRAWDHLAEIREGYEDLTRLALDGMVNLPKSWPGVTWPIAAI
ncbi:hypothetical protein ACWEKT_39035 [Nocardia takedensis]